MSYVGQTTNENRRRKEHLQAAKGQRTDSHTYFHRALGKYGPDKFEYRVIEKCEANTLKELQILLDEAEIKWINIRDSYNNGYNTTEGGLSHEPWNKGKTGIYSDETIQKMKDAKIDFIPWNKGTKDVYHPTEETKLKTSESMRAVWANNEEMRLKVSLSASGRIWISNDDLCLTKMVKPAQLQEYLDTGWVKGRKKYY